MFTNRSKVLGVTALAVIVVGGLSYSQYATDKKVASLEQPAPVTVTKVVVVTPTTAPTATPAATLKYTPVVKTTVPVVKAVVK